MQLIVLIERNEMLVRLLEKYRQTLLGDAELVLHDNQWMIHLALWRHIRNFRNHGQ